MKANQQNNLAQTKIIEAAVLANINNEHKQNGVKEPNEKDSSRPIWDALNELVEYGLKPSVLTARKLAAKNNWNVNATVVVFYCWSKFHNPA